MSHRNSLLSNKYCSLVLKQHGFTLIEILVALFIFTIVSTIMVTALHSIVTTQAATEKNARRFAELQLAMLVLSRDFEQTIDRPVMNATNLLENPFNGTNNLVAFTQGGLANPLGQLQRSTLQRIRYRVEKETLLRESWGVLDQTEKSIPTPRALLQNVSDLRFEYLDPQDKFVDRWPPADQFAHTKFPRAVRVTITMPDLGKITQLYIIPSQPAVPPPGVQPPPGPGTKT